MFATMTPAISGVPVHRHVPEVLGALGGPRCGTRLPTTTAAKSEVFPRKLLSASYLRPYPPHGPRLFALFRSQPALLP